MPLSDFFSEMGRFALRARGRNMFDPEGDGYDFESAIAAGLGPDDTGHWPSRDPRTGLLLKGRGHPTFHKTIEGEQKMGFEIFMGEDGRYYSRKPR